MAMTGPGDLALSLLMLAGVLLGAGGIWLLVKRRDRKRALLMLAASLVMFGNVAIWMVPLG
jgi:LPXTG-motif cell wall-anchored protein